MFFSLESLAAVATIVGTGIGILALIQSRAWLIVTSLLLVTVCLGAVLYARRERLSLKSASVTIDGHSIDSLNVANLRRRVNRTLMIQEAHHTARIDNGDMQIEWTYAGYCRAKRESAIEFSIESERTTPFERMGCIGYDLERDPKMNHGIKPILVGATGVTKKLAVPFLEPLRRNQPFRVSLKCTLPQCITPGFGYYSSTLSFAQDRVSRCTVRLIFAGPAPSWVRSYDCSLPGQPALLRTLMPTRQSHGEHEYIDMIDNAKGQSARVYAFWRDTI
jgi:hypothetical protein